jgi:hypothetical protein
MIPAHLLDLEPSLSFKPVKMGLDGGGEGVSPSSAARNQRQTDALFSDTHRSLRTALVTKATPGRGSRWDESDSESEAEFRDDPHKRCALVEDGRALCCALDCNGRGSGEL